MVKPRIDAVLYVYLPKLYMIFHIVKTIMYCETQKIELRLRQSN